MRVFASDRIGRGYRTRKRRKSKKKAGFLKRLGRWLLIFGFAVFVLSLMLVLPFRWLDPPTTAFMLQDDSGRKPVLYEWIAWKDVGTALPIAVVASEDQKFASHFGFDVKAG